MKISHHAFSRILGRTKMFSDDVLSLIEKNAVISLGMAEGREYLLFYSPEEKEAKIAVVSDSREILVTVLRRGHRLPLGITKVTQPLINKAKVALQKFLFSRFDLETATKKVEAPVPCFHLEVQVVAKRGVEYAENCGEIPHEFISSKDLVLTHIAPVIKKITAIVDAHRCEDWGNVFYSVLIYRTGNTKIIQKHQYNHNKLVAQLGTG